MSDAFPKVVIGGRDYKLHRLEPLVAGRIAARVAQLLAPVLKDQGLIKLLIDGARTPQTPAEGAPAAPGGIASLMGNEGLLSALASGVAGVDPEELFEVGLKCIRGRLFTDKRLHDDEALNRHFEEFQSDLLPVMAWAIKENCAGFFGFGAKA